MLTQFLVNLAGYRHGRDLMSKASPEHQARVRRIQITVMAVLLMIIAGVVVVGLAVRPR